MLKIQPRPISRVRFLVFTERDVWANMTLETARVHKYHHAFGVDIHYVIVLTN